MPRTLGHLLTRRGEQGEALPPVLRRLDDMRARFRRGQVSLIAGRSGGGKSALAMHIACRLPDTPTIYWSADTDLNTLAVRAVASLRHQKIDDAETSIELDREEIADFLDEELSHIWWADEPGPSLEDIDLEVEAFAHVYGIYPHLIVIDNLMDIYGDSPEEATSFKNTMAFSNELSRRTNAHVMVLCHVKGKYESGDHRGPIGLDGPLQNVVKKPRLILTIYQPQAGLMGISVVKNTTGPADPTGKMLIQVGWVPGRMWVGE